MNIYEFLNSRDIAEHCRNICHTWTPFEMAVIIGRSHRTMAEKHAAWRELIADYPDMPTLNTAHYPSYESLHKKLEEYIGFEERMLEIFKTPEQQAFFKYATYDGHYEGYGSKAIFTTFEKAWADVVDSLTCKDIIGINIQKIFPDDDSSEISATFDREGNLYRICAYGSAVTGRYTDVNLDIQDMFYDRFYVYIPTPFKHGDILCLRRNVFRHDKNHIICVLDYLDYHDADLPKNKEWIEKAIKGETGDGTDLTGEGLYHSDGFLYNDHIDNYDDCEYYRGKLTGNDRILYFASLYLKEKIDLGTLLAMQQKVMLENNLKNVFMGCSCINLEAEYDLALMEEDKIIGCNCPKCSDRKEAENPDEV